MGTSTAKEGKEYFSELDSHVIPFLPMSQPEEDLIDMCFRRKRCEERKEWMNEWTEDRVVDYCGILWNSIIRSKFISFDNRFCEQGVDSV